MMLESAGATEHNPSKLLQYCRYSSFLSKGHTSLDHATSVLPSLIPALPQLLNTLPWPWERDPQDTQLQQLLQKQERDNGTPQTSAPITWKSLVHIHGDSSPVFMEGLFYFLGSLSFAI